MDKDVSREEIGTDQVRLDTRSENFWGKLRVKEDKKGFFYYDVLVGKKENHEAHVHMGYDLIGNPIFVEDRGRIENITRNIESNLHGKLPTEKFEYKKTTPKLKVSLGFRPDGPTKSSIVNKFELIEF